MTVPITLNNLANLQNQTTAVNTINGNNAAITTAFGTAVSRSGDQMTGTLDMNNNQVINLPAPSTVNSPARLIDVVSNPSIVIPGTGTSGHVVGYLDGNNTTSGNNTHSGTETFNGTVNLNGTTNFSSAIPNSALAQMANNTVKGNISGSTANPSDVTLASLITALNLVNSIGGSTGTITLNAADLAIAANQISLSAARKTFPTRQVFTGASSGTYTTPANCQYIRIRLIGGGGGGGTTVAGNGSATTFAASLSGGGGQGGAGGTTGGSGGVGSGGNILNLSGGPGGCGGNANVANVPGASGGNGFFGGAGTASNSVAIAPAANTGAGGSATTTNGTGGGAGGYVEHIINNPAATYPYIVGAGGNAGSNGTAGANGIIIVEEFYGT